jgi:Holliday junction resolvasome RuvABC endonuclease subunit
MDGSLVPWTGAPEPPPPAETILALDLAGIVGWAFGHERPPRFGTWHLPHMGGEGARYASAENEIYAAIVKWQPRHIVIEAHLPLAAMNNVAAMRQAISLRAVARIEAYRASIPVFEIDSQTVRRDVIGQGRFSKDTAKKEVVGWCRRQGWKVPDHNAGDACVIWEWYRRLIGRHSFAAGVLFADC